MPTGVYKRSKITKEKMANARKEWYKNNPSLASSKAEKCSETKKKQGKWKGKDNPNYGSGKFIGEPYKGEIWSKGLTKETHPTLKRLSVENMGAKNPHWKGDKVGKNPLHLWIKRYKPKPDFCVRCNRSKPYDLANISGEYKRDINDFEWLCRRCHMQGDGRLKNLKMKGGKRNG